MFHNITAVHIYRLCCVQLSWQSIASLGKLSCSPLLCAAILQLAWQAMAPKGKRKAKAKPAVNAQPQGTGEAAAERQPDAAQEGVKMPKPIVAVRDALGLRDGDIVKAEDVQKLDSATRTKAFSCLSTTLASRFPARSAEYKALDSDKKRREWLAVFIQDPQAGCCSASSQTTVSNITDDNDRELWLTLEELAGPQYMNSEANANIAITSMASRPHEQNAALAAAGVKQYQYFQRHVDRKRKLTDQATCATTADMSSADYLTVKEAMLNSMGGAQGSGGSSRNSGNRGRTRRGQSSLNLDMVTGPAITTGNPTNATANNELTAAKEEAESQLKKTKTFFDKMRKELKEVEVVEARLKAKQWGSQMVEYLRAATDTALQKADELFARWLEAQQKSDDCTTKEDYNQLAGKLASEHQEADTAYKKFLTEVLGEFKKFK